MPEPNATSLPDVDLTNCDREPIHILGRVQSYGCLISTSSDWIVNHASENCVDHLGVEASALVGTPLFDHLSEDVLHTIRSKMQIMSGTDSAARIIGVDVLDNGRLFDVSVHNSGRSHVFEFEPKSMGGETDQMALVQPLLKRLSALTSIEDMARLATRALKAMTGFDRVMVYQFGPDDSGRVIAEALAPGLEPYLGLRYPASDIPKQARALYTRSLLRLIGDVNDPGSPIFPAHNPQGEPLDLSMSITRAVSPIHLEYLRNMGVGASMSASILREGALWGLFAFHHRTPMTLDYEKRTAVELFAQFFAYEMANKEHHALSEQDARARDLHDKLMVRVSNSRDFLDNFPDVDREISEAVEYDGIALYSDGQFIARGSTPTEEEFMGLARFLNTSASSEVYATDNLVARYPAAADFMDRAAGILALPISRTPRDYIVLFRREIAMSVQWAGNPDKPVEHGPNGVRLTPRKSFEAWRQVVRERSTPWSKSDLRLARALRITLVEVVLKLTDEAAQERKRASDRQKLLIAELNHRVRNILNLIQALVSQGQATAQDLEGFTEVLDGRIQSLARAHDQLTRENWGPVLLRSLIEVEAKAFVGAGRGTVVIEGDEVMLKPEAFSSFALVIHELVTNSVKYGALREEGGAVTVSTKLHPDGTLMLGWSEQGGPAVQAPTRQGFGTTIIEKTIPFELKGSAKVDYRVTGLLAEFTIPASYVERATVQVSSQAAPEDVPAPSTGIVPSGQVMIVEDNMLIAMDAGDMLDALGADHVHFAASVQEALAIIETVDLDLCVLDVNLGDETSVGVAKTLAERGIPFVLATGYGAYEDITRTFPPCPIVEKPYTEVSLSKAFADLGTVG